MIFYISLVYDKIYVQEDFYGTGIELWKLFGV